MLLLMNYKSINDLHLLNNLYLDMTASMHINAVLCVSVLSAQNAGLPVEWHQKFSTLSLTPLAHRKALSESYAMHIVSC